MARKQYDDDDGRVVANMRFTERNSWYETYSALNKKRKPEKKQKDDQVIQRPNGELMSKKETRSMVYSALLAALTVGLVFGGVFFAFIWFAVNIWLK